MEVKDWILLFTPIISNGLIIFLVQFLIMEKHKRKQEKKQLQNETYKGLYNRLQSLTTGSLEVYLKKNKFYELDKDIHQKNSAMEELLIYCYSNHTAFEDINYRITDIKETWDNVYNLWIEYKTKLPDKETDLKLDPSIYAELFDFFIAWMVCAELLKTNIINKL